MTLVMSNVGQYSLWLTLSLRSTALRPLFVAFSTAAGTRFGLNVDCLEGGKTIVVFHVHVLVMS